MERYTHIGRLFSGAVAVVALSACSGSDAEPQAALEAEPSPTTPAPVAVDSATTSTTTTDAASSTTTNVPTEGTGSQAEVAPLVPFEDNSAPNTSTTNDSDAWVSRRSMSASAIEVVWAAPEGAASYELHRIASDSDQPPALETATADTLLATTDFNGTFEDDVVAEGATYWYAILGMEVDGTVSSVGWHKTVAITDETAPETVEFSVEGSADGVLVSWTPPEENFQLHAYRILRGVDSAEPESIATTWNLDQISFIDPNPPAGEVTYSVVALDFHWNVSEGAEQTIVVPEAN